MSQESAPVTVHILDKEYRISCGDDEKDALLSSARYLDARMREIRQSGRVIGTDRIAVMAALNIAHELLDQQQSQTHNGQLINQRIQNLQKKIELALGANNRLDLQAK